MNRARRQAVAMAALCLVSGGALACTTSPAPSMVDLTVNITAADGPGAVRVVSGRPSWISGCDVRLVQPVTVALESTNLTPAGTVDYRGKTYVTYEQGPSSPLFFFPVHVKTSDPGNTGGYELVPAVQGTGTPVDAVVGTGDQMMTYPYVGVVVRMGMQSLPATLVGTEVVQHTRFPHAIRHQLNVTVNVTPATCALLDAAVRLDDVSADRLPAAGQATPEQDFAVTLQCTAAGIPVTLALTDANDPAATGSLLQPTSNATARGVQVELLRAGVPVVLGQPWNHGVSRNGAQSIGLQARYARVAGGFQPGAVEGQAILTATYR
nr:fimbrial protein [Stenotrophomonas pavanii]